MSLFMANYRRKLRMDINLRRKEKIEKTTEFVEKMRKVQKEAGIVVQEEMK